MNETPTAENRLPEHPHVAAVRDYLNNAGITSETLRYAATHEALCRSWIFDLLTNLADVMETTSDWEDDWYDDDEPPGCDHEWLDRPESDTHECLVCGIEGNGPPPCVTPPA